MPFPLLSFAGVAWLQIEGETLPYKKGLGLTFSRCWPYCRGLEPSRSVSGVRPSRQVGRALRVAGSEGVGEADNFCVSGNILGEAGAADSGLTSITTAFCRLIKATLKGKHSYHFLFTDEETEACLLSLTAHLLETLNHESIT